MLEIVNGVRRVYQDLPLNAYTWTNIWLDGKLVGSIEMRSNRIMLDTLTKKSEVTKYHD